VRAALGDAATGDLTQAQIDAQINQLNHCFGPASFVFQLAGVSRYKNAAWWNLDVNGQVPLALHTCCECCVRWPSACRKTHCLHAVIMHRR